MNSPIVTADLSKFGYREIKITAELLQAYVEQGADFLSSDVQINFNSWSGYVFLTDEDFNVAMMNGSKLEQFFDCPECGREGFQEEFEEDLCRGCKGIAN